MRKTSTQNGACDPAQGHFRSYRIDVGTDLHGDWLLGVTSAARPT